MTRIVNSVGDLSEEGKIQRLESVKRTLEEKMSLLQRLDGEILERVLRRNRKSAMK